MKLNGQTHIPADQQTVWEALNDPEVLRACIQGCDSLEKTADDRFDAKVTAKVGPVKASFTGQVTLSEIDAPNSYVITGEGKGGAAGFAKGSAKVSLTPAEGGTALSYDATAQVGGKLAQLGARLVEGTAKRYAESFFAAFTERVGGGSAPETMSEQAADEVLAEATTLEPPQAAPPKAEPPSGEGLAKRGGTSPIMWLGAAVGIIILLTLIAVLT